MQPSHALMIGTTGDRGRSSRAQERPPWGTLGGDNIGVGQSRKILGGGPVKSIKIWDEALEVS